MFNSRSDVYPIKVYLDWLTFRVSDTPNLNFFGVCEHPKNSLRPWCLAMPGLLSCFVFMCSHLACVSLSASVCVSVLSSFLWDYCLQWAKSDNENDSLSYLCYWRIAHSCLSWISAIHSSLRLLVWCICCSCRKLQLYRSCHLFVLLGLLLLRCGRAIAVTWTSIRYRTECTTYAQNLTSMMYPSTN